MSYRWYVLTLAALTDTFAIAVPMMSMPVLFKEISEDLDLNLVQLGTVWGVGGLGAICVLLIGGVLGDRFGIKRVLSVTCFLAGLTGAMRGLSGSFISLTATTLLFSLLYSTIPVNVHKTCAIWFPGRQLALANGVVTVGMALGFTVAAMISATILSPLLGGWRNVIFLYGAISIAVSILWLLTRSEPSQVESSTGNASTAPFRQTLLRLVHIRGLWLLGFILLGQMGSVQGMLGYLPLYLRNIGWMPASADGALAAFNVASMIGAIPIALLSDRLGSRKVILFTATVMTAIGVGLLSIAGGALVWVSVIIAGSVRDGFMAVLVSAIIETEGVGATYAGTAVGLVLTLSHLGMIVSPPVGNSFASINLGLPFIFWAALAAAALISFYFVKETGKKAFRKAS